jgi:hypothetical protein
MEIMYQKKWVLSTFDILLIRGQVKTKGDK